MSGLAQFQVRTADGSLALSINAGATRFDRFDPQLGSIGPAVLTQLEATERLQNAAFRSGRQCCAVLCALGRSQPAVKNA
eukprot:4984215-Alexandrium_andersonii.AAC.1